MVGRLVDPSVLKRRHDLTQHGRTLEYLIANEFLRQEPPGFFLVVGQSSYTKARENQNPVVLVQFGGSHFEVVEAATDLEMS